MATAKKTKKVVEAEGVAHVQATFNNTTVTITDSRGNAQVVEAIVPLANMFGYVNQLRSFTQGRAQYTMQFSHYDEVPQNVADEVKAKLA